MEDFRFFLFGLIGASVIFWVSVITFWLASIYPTLFSDDRKIEIATRIATSPEMITSDSNLSFMKKGALRPLIKDSSLIDRSKYSRKALVVADFSIGNNQHSNNSLYTFILMSLGVMSFLFIIHGLMPSGLSLLGLEV